LTPEQAAIYDSTCLALGRFVMRFSGLTRSLENATAHLMGGTGNPLVAAVLADRTAQPILKAYVSVLVKKWEGSLTNGDIRLVGRIQKEITTLIEARNRLMHDAWMGQTIGGDPGPHPMVRIRVRLHGKGLEHESTRCTPEYLHGLADDATRLAVVVNASAFYLRPGQVGPEFERRLEVGERGIQVQS
jgi:hypothetical protein